MACRIVAELGANHNGSVYRALKLLDAAKSAGASALKLQTWHPDRMVLDRTIELEDGPWAGQNLAALYHEALLPWDGQRRVFAAAEAIGFECFSSVFDLESLVFLEDMGCPRYKIASFEIIDLPLIYAVARKRKPMIISTGMAEHFEIEEAVQTARQGGATDITLLRCTSAYPADGSEANLASIDYYRRRFRVAAGISDHTPGIGVAMVAAALGASVIEKHLTWRRDEGGLDSAFSIEPEELQSLAHEIEQVPLAIGQPRFGHTAHEEPQAKLRRSLYFTADLDAGTRIEPADVRTARPANGIAPVFYHTVIGACVTRPVRRHEPVTWEALSINQRAIRR